MRSWRRRPPLGVAAPSPLSPILAGPGPAFFFALILLSAPGAFAQSAAPGGTAPAPVVLPEFLVTGERIGHPVLSVPRSDLRAPEPNLAPELLAIPGVYGHSRATDAMEPSIRGLGFDRVATTFNGVPLVNASPERTYSPVAVLGPVSPAEITVLKALPSVTAGPATTGGRITLATGETARARADGFGASLKTTYHGARDGFSSLARFRLDAGPWTAAVSGFANDLGDYTAPDGRRVAAQLKDTGATASLGWHSPTREIQIDVLQRRLQRQDAVSLPLDGRDTETQLLTVGDRWHGGSGALAEISWHAGGSFTDPFITSAARPVPTLIYAHSLARTVGGGLATVWRTGADSTLTAGADHSHQSRRAIRTTPAGQDFIWPDVVYSDTGIFAEWNGKLSSEWQLRLGARADEVRSDARAADRLALGRPVREQYVAYNGPAAAAIARSNQAGAANALLNWRTGNVSAFVGAGFSVQPAQVMERYRAFLNALGGDGQGGNAVELGNPALAAEDKWALEAGGTWRHDRIDLEGTAYYYRVDDFITRTRLGTTQPPLAPMVVFGYRNIDAELYGAELGVTLKTTKALIVPLTFALSEGRNRATGADLAEIPPWEATAAMRLQSGIGSLRFWTELGTRLVGGRDNPAPLENPLYGHAGGFALCHLRAGAPLGRHLRIEAGVENLFNRTYTEYLTPPVAPFKPASGNLLPGERIPGPRRSLWVSVTWQL